MSEGRDQEVILVPSGGISKVAAVRRVEQVRALYSFRLDVDYLGGVVSNVKCVVLLKEFGG